DLMHSVNGMFRVLDMLSEPGRYNFLVNKIIICQESLKAFINELSPGAYSSLTKVDFKALDQLLIKPVGIYGSKSEIAAFLSAQGVVDELTANALCLSKDNDAAPSLRSGLYLLRSFGLEPGKEQIFVIYWPEDTTWDDNANPTISRNRETFMRYLTKMCDQVTCLISEEHAQSIVWSGDSEDAAASAENNPPRRQYKFKVAKTNEQEETVAQRTGFKITTPLYAIDHPHLPAFIDPAVLKPRLISGETRQGFLTTEYVPAGLGQEPLAQETYNETQIRSLLKEAVEFSPGLPDDAIDALTSPQLGLLHRYGNAFEDWKSRRERAKRSIDESIQKDDANLLSEITKDTEGKMSVYRQALIDRLLDAFPLVLFFPVLPPTIAQDALSSASEPEPQFAHLTARYRFINQELDGILHSNKADEVRPEEKFKIMKDNLTYIEVFLEQRSDLTSSQREKNIRELCRNSGSLISSQSSIQSHGGAGSYSWNPLFYAARFIPFSSKLEDQAQFIRDEARRRVAKRRTSEFLAGLEEMLEAEPSIHEIVSETIMIVTDHLKTRVDKLLRTFMAKVIHALHGSEQSKLEQTRVKLLADSSCDSVCILRKDMETKIPSAKSRPYKVQGFRRCNRPPVLNCRIHQLSLTTHDSQMLQMDPTSTPFPRVMPNAPCFLLSPERRIVHAQLIESGDLFVIEDSTHMLIYLEKPGGSFRRPRKSLHRDKIGERAIITYDETTRMLLICAATELKFYLYGFDETFSALQSIDVVNLTRWYASGVSITHACFVAGSQEILVVDSTNMARIYSLVPQQFRPASLRLPRAPISAYSSPDGACLFLSYENEYGSLSFCAYHWDTFGSSQGIDLGQLQVPISSLSLTSLVNRRNVHLIGLGNGVCESIALDITKKATEFMFKEAMAVQSPEKKKHAAVTHNCLIDCHSDVWTRFPVVAAVQRNTIISSKNRLPRSFTFSTYSDHTKFAPHFDDLICSFEQRTRKPTGNELKKLEVHAVDIDAVTMLLSASNEWTASEFRAGEWLVDLLCLIPIQIAVTQENRFIPLKDGVVSTALEQNLLGAEVSQIVDSISIGWYESVFQSYMASKPIKVVSSMGEQSVGKSFCLNHLVDTSFAGSAMRTTEGVWMSVTPTDETLIVALDFEGRVHSIERSAQEDALLVLFNTAISNLVLFRNNFAISRSISGLFQSFQSSSTVLDPAANPQLFKSTLVIIIKDVVDSDEHEIVREYVISTQKIVEDEQDANFISRLHAGQLDIIPWPVIESKQFYALFPALKRTLNQQEITHVAAGEFLHTLKTLMAKLKANDWGALSETLAAHRAQKLCTYLNRALEFGFYETEPANEPLKNFDTDNPIDHPVTPSRFFLSASKTTREERQNIMSTLQKSWDKFDTRHQTPEVEWIAGLTHFLQARAEMRIEYVFHWIKSNLARFKSNHANMDVLRRDFDTGAVDLRSNVEICRMQCASCNLLCLLSRRHEADILHDCQTSHICPHPCDFGEEHSQAETCGYPAGHSGKHICVVGVHLCGEPCVLEDKNGCMKKCTKVAKHSSDEEHMCDARKHACGEPCGLKLSAHNIYSCPQTCAIPSHEAHDQHVCNTPACPMTCELCMRLCANTDHLHGLLPDAQHLCGQEHKCSALCSAPGICQIDTAPQSIEATFTGRHETFQYTKYSQDSKRLRCAIMIQPNEREHIGRHLHSEETDPFHFCETRCLNCGYFCTLPLGHPQQDHETSHGSMSKTSWSIDGPDDTILELKGRKFASNDDGAPMMCNLVCQDMGRHVHIDYCRATEDSLCDGAELEHIDVALAPNPTQPKDWISHSLFWKRTGKITLLNPYSRDDQANFAKCDSMCPGRPEHTTTNPPIPSYCILPVLHPQAAGQVYVAPAGPDGQGYISSDGHSYTCQNPAEMHPAYHVIFFTSIVLNVSRSSSMAGTDYQPLPNRPGADLIIRHSNNRLGAVFSSLHAFWVSRSSALNAGRRGMAGGRKDAYSVIFFDRAAHLCLRNDTQSTPDQLLHSVLGYTADGWTNPAAALSETETLMRECWSDSLAPVVIFLSDGECEDALENVESLSHAAVDLGKPLSFHTVLFGTDYGRDSLDSMAQSALEIQNAAPNNGAQVSVPSSFSEALDEVRLAETFLGFAESLRKPRGSLLR
ncbi:hypothetical protein B0H11DRAFT_1709774, partial [Mycena galericulata]